MQLLLSYGEHDEVGVQIKREATEVAEMLGLPARR